MGILDIFGGGMEIDDVKSLPVDLQNIYINPHKSLGIDVNSTDINLLRELFRKGCLSLIPHFVGCGKPKLKEAQLNFAYHLVRGNVKGPAKAISDNFDTNPYLDFKADYILPLLKPMRSSVFCSKEYRGFRMLGVSNSSHRYSVSYLMIPKFVFVFDVHYVLRGHKVERDYEEFISLHAELEKELLTVPVLPEFVVGSSIEHFGNQLAQYIMRIHVTLANKGLFSPRLMKFLSIDYERVQTEEEGAIVALLDTPYPPSQTAWHIVDEKWLSTWRSFVMGRGPRRYFAPGPIDNRTLLALYKSGKSDLALTKDYRCVNYNVWRFYQLVHGGGPAISRLTEDIYSPVAYSSHQAAIMIQTRVRIFLCRARRRVLFMKRLSTTQVAKSVIIETAREDVRCRAEDMINEARRERTKKNLESAAIFTQSLWRIKKQYVPEANLEIKQRDQAVFNKVRNVVKDIPESAGADGVVVQDLQGIVHIGSTYGYQRVLTDFEGGIPFAVSRRPGTQEALIESSKDPSQYIRGSRITAINGLPTSALSYEEIKDKLTKAVFPVTLDLQRPMEQALVPTLDAIIAMGENDDILRFSAFKLMLHHGLPLIKHNTGNGKYHLTTLRISDKDLFYRSAYDFKKEEDELWNRFSLFKLKFILAGTESETVKRKKLSALFCFEIVSEDRGIVFELPTPDLLAALQTREFEMREARRLSALADKENGSRRSGSKAAGSKAAGSVRRSIMGSVIGSVLGDNHSAASPGKPMQRKTPSVGGGGASVSSSLAPNRMTMAQSFMELIGRGTISGLEEQEHAAKARVVVAQLRRLVEEVRGSQIFVDKPGMPIKRTKPKVTLRKVDN